MQRGIHRPRAFLSAAFLETGMKKCKRCNKSLPDTEPYYMNIEHKNPLRVCEDCYIVVTQGMGGNGWRKIKPSSCEEIREGLNLLESLEEEMKRDQSSI